jgi:hypothetical protein
MITIRRIEAMVKIGFPFVDETISPNLALEKLTRVWD